VARDYLYAAVAPIPDFAVQAVLLGKPQHEVSETHTLNPASHHDFDNRHVQSMGKNDRR